MRRFERLLDRTIFDICEKYKATFEKKYDEKNHEINYSIHLRSTDDTLKLVNEIEMTDLGGLIDAFPENANTVTCYYAWSPTNDAVFKKELVCVNKALENGYDLGDGTLESDKNNFCL